MLILWIAIHAVDKIHAGKDDSSVMYIPACPLTETNADYLVRQREAFFEGISLTLADRPRTLSLLISPRRDARSRLPLGRGRKSASGPLDSRFCDAEYRHRGPARYGADEI